MSFRRNLAASFVVILASGVAFAQDTKEKKIEGYGKVVDPKGDCTFKDDKGKLTITIPGVSHNLNKDISDLDAPRVLQEVEGDFTLEVKVSGDFAPNAESTVAPRGFAFNGAGLLIWVDEKNFLRLERNVWITNTGAGTCYPPLVEVQLDGKFQNTSPMPTAYNQFFKNPATWFRLERKGPDITPAYSHDGKEWTTGRALPVKFPNKLSVGVAAVNTSKKSFEPTFEELKLTKAEAAK